MGDVNKLTKADLILAKMEALAKQTSRLEARVANSSNDAVLRKMNEENAKLKKDINYLSAQLEGVCTTLVKLIKKLPAEMGATGGLDVDDLSSRVAAKIIIPEAELGEIDTEALAGKLTGVPGDIDYDELGFAVAKRLYIPQAVAEEVDYDQLAKKIAENLPALAVASEETAATVYTEPVAVQAELDYDLLAGKIAEIINVQEPVSADYIAARVAEQIVIPQTVAAEGVDIDVEELSRKVADKIVIPNYEPVEAINEERLAEAVAEKIKEEQEAPTLEANIDEQALAEDIASRLNFSLSDELIAAAVVKNLSDAIDSDEIADCVAKRVGTISPEQFEITVDDDGCNSLAEAVEDKLDYDKLANAILEKLSPSLMAGTAAEIDSEELAKAISDKLAVTADINEDVLADKAAAILSNYMPEVDCADIADKVIAGIIPALPSTPVIDSEAIASSVSEKIIESQADSDFDIVIDEEGVDRISDSVSEEINKDAEERYTKVTDEMNYIKDEYGTRFDRVDEDIAEIKRMLLAGIVVTNTESAVTEVVETVEEPVEEELVTVSDIVIEEPVEEEPEEDEVIEDIVEEIDETPSEAEIMPDGMDEMSGGVDFANMMKYNRSFIARIIQGTDEQKNYYGQVKTALLSYKKVNSNVAWGSERFNKGRETIARFKIRGKTLCLYLALDPNEFATSVYHHADVSDNKSMHGTPMMVKIKSPRGVKKAVRLIDEMLLRRNGEKRNVAERDYAAMYPYETIEELIEDGLVKDVSKK